LEIYNILLYFEEVIGRQINFNKLNYKIGKDQKREKYYEGNSVHFYNLKT